MTTRENDASISICRIVRFVFSLFVILVISRFGFEGWISVLNDSVPDLSIRLPFVTGIHNLWLLIIVVNN